MAEAIRKPQAESSSEDDDNDVVNSSNSTSSEDNCVGGADADSDNGKEAEPAESSVSVQQEVVEFGGGGEGRMKLCVKMDPCLLCSQPAVGYDSEGKLMKKMRQHASQRPQFNYTRLFGFLCKGLSIKSYYGMVKADWNFGSGASGASPFPFCERCESLINTLAGTYTKLEAVKTELKERMLDGEEVYMRDELYSKQDVRFYNFRKLVLGVDFKGTVKGRMFQSQQANSDGYEERPTCFDESMFPPNHPGSSWATANPTNRALVDDDHDGDDECGSSSSADGHRLAKKPKVGASLLKAAAAASADAVSSSSLPVIKRKLAKAKRTKGVPAPIFTPETSGFMERCMETGKITYYSGAGVDKEKEGNGGCGANSGTTPSAPQPTRKIIVFTPTLQEEQYQCTECGELVPLLRVRKMQQQQLFRHHFLKYHTDRFKCKICRSSSPSGTIHEPMDKEELVAHLESKHEITEWNDYLKICQQYQGTSKCPTCGKLVKGGKGGLILHMKTHDARPFICSVCGQSYSDKCDCNGHMEKEHPEGKWDRFVCKYPGCTRSLEGELGLRKHIQEEHGDCEEARRLMCFECGKVFNIAHGVKRHVKTVHEGVLEFECSQCSRK